MQLSANGTWLSIAAPYNNGQMAILEEQRTIFFFCNESNLQRKTAIKSFSLTPTSDVNK